MNDIREIISILNSKKNIDMKKLLHRFDFINLYLTCNLIDMMNMGKSYNEYCNILISNRKMYSYDFCISKNEIDVMDKLIMTDDYSSLYLKDDFAYMSKLCIDIIRNNNALIEDFYI